MHFTQPSSSIVNTEKRKGKSQPPYYSRPYRLLDFLKGKKSLSLGRDCEKHCGHRERLGAKDVVVAARDCQDHATSYLLACSCHFLFRLCLGLPVSAYGMAVTITNFMLSAANYPPPSPEPPRAQRAACGSLAIWKWIYVCDSVRRR